MYRRYVNRYLPKIMLTNHYSSLKYNLVLELTDKPDNLYLSKALNLISQKVKLQGSIDSIKKYNKLSLTLSFFFNSHFQISQNTLSQIIHQIIN